MIDMYKLETALKYRDEKHGGGLNSPRTLHEYTRVAEQLLRATEAEPLICTSQAKWLQVKAVTKRLLAAGVVPAGHEFFVKGEFVKRDEASFEERVLTEEQFMLLLEHLPRTAKGRELAFACKIAYFTGLRRSEVINLKPSQIDLIADHALTIRLKGKGGKIRKAFLPQIMREEIGRFVGFSITSNYLGCTVNRIIKEIRDKDPDFPNTNFHGLRHSFATHRLRKGTNIKELQSILGHSNPATTMIYLHAINGVPESMRKEGY